MDKPLIEGTDYIRAPRTAPPEKDACTGCMAQDNALCGALPDYCLSQKVIFVRPVVAGAATATLPTDAAARKAAPVFSGCLTYFPLAIAEVARVSVTGAKQHNLPGLSFDRTKSKDHGDCVVRHQLEFDKIDTDGHYHAAKVAWRALAQLQVLLETPK